MNRSQAEKLVDYHCSDPKGAMIVARGSLVCDDQAFDELLAAIAALEPAYRNETLIPKRVAACLMSLPEEIRGVGNLARDHSEVDARKFWKMASKVSDAISKAVWPNTDRINVFGVNPAR